MVYQQALANLNQLPGNWHANRMASGLLQQQWQQQVQDAQQRAQADLKAAGLVTIPTP